MTIKFGAFARLKRTEAGITIAKCATALGIKPDAYLKKEQGNRGWSLDNIIKLAAVHGLEASELLAFYKTGMQIQ